MIAPPSRSSLFTSVETVRYQATEPAALPLLGDFFEVHQGRTYRWADAAYHIDDGAPDYDEACVTVRDPDAEALEDCRYPYIRIDQEMTLAIDDAGGVALTLDTSASRATLETRRVTSEATWAPAPLDASGVRPAFCSSDGRMTLLQYVSGVRFWFVASLQSDEPGCAMRFKCSSLASSDMACEIDTAFTEDEPGLARRSKAVFPLAKRFKASE